MAAAQWWVQQSTGALRQSAASPGSGWILIAGSAGMTQQQAANQLVQQVLHDNQGVNIAPGVQKAATGAVNAVASATGLTGLDGFISSLGTKTLWIRVAKVVIGGALLLIGIAHMTGASDAVSSAARKVPVIV